MRKLFLFLFLLFCLCTEALPPWRPAHFGQNYPDWMREQVDEDLSFFQEGISSDTLDSLMREYGKEWLLVRCQMKNGRVRVSHNFENNFYPLFLNRIGSITSALERLSQMAELPDCDFLISFLDSVDFASPKKMPIFTFAKIPELSEVILIPDFEALSGNSLLLKDTEEANGRYPWEKKKNQAVWRGGTTGEYPVTEAKFFRLPRSAAVRASLEFPSLVDARFTELVQSSEKLMEKFPEYFGKRLSLSEHIAYKYQLLIDGNSCAYSRAYWQLFSNSLIFKQDSPAVQWYYRALKPYVHYIPLKRDLSDLIFQLQWAIRHDEEAKKISERAEQFARENLSHFSILQYLHLLLTEYAKLIR